MAENKKRRPILGAPSPTVSPPPPDEIDPAIKLWAETVAKKAALQEIVMLDKRLASLGRQLNVQSKKLASVPWHMVAIYLKVRRVPSTTNIDGGHQTFEPIAEAKHRGTEK